MREEDEADNINKGYFACTKDHLAQGLTRVSSVAGDATSRAACEVSRRAGDPTQDPRVSSCDLWMGSQGTSARRLDSTHAQGQ